ncbi:cytochrome P450 71BT1-like [Triticum dicoccoides]|uniref:cytochrome P450 71BT1-like n=1 Tax=Triticum dicoccoides TaxID=85692 RepID=UPI00188F54D1|nr:cytochrome P450 71BT1-like [Triticum dicoccoides]
MEFVLTVLLLSIVLCISAVAVFRRRAWAWAVHDGQQLIIEIRDPTIARRALMDHADAFCNRPLNLFPVALVSGRRRSHSDNLTSVPYDPRWRALRCTLNAAVLHPSRLGHTDPLRLEAFVLAFDGSIDFAGSKTAKLLHWRQWRRFLSFRGKQAELFLPLVNTRRNANRHLTLSGGLPAYLDHLLDARVPVDDDTADGKALRPLIDDELVSLLSEFLGAGPGTVVSSMEWTLAHLVLQPEVQNNIRREVDAVEGALSEARVRQMKYMHAVVLESLRLHPPILVFLRDVADQAVAEILGCAAAAVPTEGMRAHFNLGEIGRDKNPLGPGTRPTPSPSPRHQAHTHAHACVGLVTRI